MDSRQKHRRARRRRNAGLVVFTGALAAFGLLYSAGAIESGGAPGLPAIAIPAQINDGSSWKVMKPGWDEADERGYAGFVQAIGRTNCSSLESCLESPANPYRHTDDRAFVGDCADMAYILRAYYAWKNGLPFSYQHAMKTSDGSAEDIRYSSNGNIVAARRNAYGAKPISAPGFIGRIGGEVSTAMFRTHPETGGGKLFDDFYPVEISRRGVRPGAIAYDIYGHVGIIYDILEDGRILVIASHPDNSVTRTVYGPNFARSKPALGAGLKAWRPVYLDGATRRADGSYAGGKLRGVANDALQDFSLEQYFGNVPHPTGEWHYGEFHHEGRTVTYYDYVRRKLAAPGFAYNPVDELRHDLQTICNSIKTRKVAVDRAVYAGVSKLPHPRKLPPNIYGTYGAWENFSTPSRDARLKVSFIQTRRSVQEFYEKYQAGDPSVRYDGDDLTGDLWEAFVEEKDKCKFIYSRSDGTRVRLNLSHVMDRLWDLSFDPYHCPERRWGASGAELATCPDGEAKTKWYNAQRHLRFQAERTYDVRMDFTADQLKPPMLAPPSEGGIGVDAPADANIREYLAGINGAPVAEFDPSSGFSRELTNASFGPATDDAR